MFLPIGQSESTSIHFINNFEMMNQNPSNSFSNTEIDNDYFNTKKKRKIRNKFTPEEDQKLRELVQKHGDHSWSLVSSLMENRNQRQCRERWKHYLSCNANEASKPWSKNEDKILLKKYNELGPKWTKIAKDLPGRSDLQVKIRYLNHIKSKKNRYKSESDDYEFDDDFTMDEDFDQNLHLNNDTKIDDIQANNDEIIEQNQKQDDNKKEIEQFSCNAESILSPINLKNDSLDLNLNLDFTPSNIISEFFQYEESNFLFQTLENEFLNWSFE